MASHISCLSFLAPGGSVTAANLDPNVFQKFTGVDDKTQIYFFKQSDTASHTVFYSDNTLIKFSATQVSFEELFQKQNCQ